MSFLRRKKPEAAAPPPPTPTHEEVTAQEYLLRLGSVDDALRMNRALNVKPAVASWIRAVEESNRKLLLTATHTWEQRHSDLLSAEIEKQLGNKSIVEGTRFKRVEPDRHAGPLEPAKTRAQGRSRLDSSSATASRDRARAATSSPKSRRAMS